MQTLPRHAHSWQNAHPSHSARQQTLQRHATRRTQATQLHSNPARVTATLSDTDVDQLKKAASLALQHQGLTAPHPNAACILFNSSNHKVVGSACQRAQGTTPSEVLAVQQAREAAKGSTAYLNLETGDCHGDESAVAALVAARVSRVVVGLRHPLRHLRNKAISAYSAAGLDVAVLGETPLCSYAQDSGTAEGARQALLSCLNANEALLHRAVLKQPFSILKYAMTLDGKIATAAGHSAWVSSAESRAKVFEMRAASDAVVVGGNTVRRDNPRLTTRRDGGHLPVRVVMSRTLDLPDKANLWDTQAAPTIVMTQRGARQSFQAHLRDRGVEVVEFDFLTPDNVAQYCYERGFLQVLWECGGTLAAPAISSGVIHKVLAFVAPKIIGGTRAPTPVGELGNVEMTQAVNLIDSDWDKIGSDLMMTGYLPSSGGLFTLESKISFPGSKSAAAAVAAASSSSDDEQQQLQRNRVDSGQVISFYKAWDEWGSLSNFSPHPIDMPVEPVGGGSSSGTQQWSSVEHYYQAQKFAGVQHPDAIDLAHQIAAALSPEEAAHLGRRAERERSELVRSDWATVKQSVMLQALRQKFNSHPGPRSMLLSTAAGSAALVENSPHDRYWGQGYDGLGQNYLGQLLMQVRQELQQQQQQEQQQQQYNSNGAGELQHSGSSNRQQQGVQSRM